jgi:hypothetical protein
MKLTSNLPSPITNTHDKVQNVDHNSWTSLILSCEKRKLSFVFVITCISCFHDLKLWNVSLFKYLTMHRTHMYHYLCVTDKYLITPIYNSRLIFTKIHINVKREAMECDYTNSYWKVQSDVTHKLSTYTLQYETSSASIPDITQPLRNPFAQQMWSLQYLHNLNATTVTFRLKCTYVCKK